MSRNPEWSVDGESATPLEVEGNEPDYIVRGYGTIYLLTPQNDAARRNLEEGVDQEAQWFGNGLAVEHRYIGDLVERLRSEGWVVE